MTDLHKIIIVAILSSAVIIAGCHNNTPVSPLQIAQVEIKLEFPEEGLEDSHKQLETQGNSVAESQKILSVRQVDSLTISVFRIDDEVFVPVIEETQIEIKEEIADGFRREYFDEVFEIPVSKSEESFFILVRAFIFSRLFLFGEAKFDLSPGEVREDPVIIKLARAQ